MRTCLSIISWGAVSPGGAGCNALRSPQSWPLVEVGEVGAPQRVHHVAKVQGGFPELDRWRPKARLRRASPISLFMIEAASQALEAQPTVDRSRVGMVCVSHLGCTLLSSKFYRQFQTEGRRFASPALFPETVTNSPLSHLAAELKIGGPVYTQIGDKSAWSAALRTAACWMENGDADAVLVLAAEEFDPHELDAFRAMRWLGKPYTRPLVEGAGAVLVQKGAKPGATRIEEVLDGFCFRTKKEAREAGEQCLGMFPPEIPVMDTASGWIHETARQILQDKAVSAHLLNIEHEAFAIAGAWDTIRAVQYLQEHPQESLVLPLWGLSQQLGAVLLRGSSTFEV